MISAVQILVATAPSVTCPAVKTIVGLRRMPVPRHSGPFASSATINTTYGCLSASGSPLVIAWTGIAKDASAIETVRIVRVVMCLILFFKLSPCCLKM